MMILKKHKGTPLSISLRKILQCETVSEALEQFISATSHVLDKSRHMIWEQRLREKQGGFAWNQTADCHSK